MYASEQFYKRCSRSSGWQQMTVTQAAQAVQKSGFPDAYASGRPLATALQKAIAKTFPERRQRRGRQGRGPGQKPSTGATGCAPGQDGSGFGRIPEGSVPKGYKIPKDADPKARKAIGWAMHQLGTLYQWGGILHRLARPGPDGPLRLRSPDAAGVRAAGVTLTRTTYTQVNEGKAVSPMPSSPAT